MKGHSFSDDKPVEDNTTLGKYWKAVKDNPTDFTGWTYLLQYVEQEVYVANLINLRECF